MELVWIVRKDTTILGVYSSYKTAKEYLVRYARNVKHINPDEIDNYIKNEFTILCFRTDCVIAY